jgi:5-hydroxyisourate hydrolase-like protein (transthyretin family)
MSALDRLNNSNQSHVQYSVDEQMMSADKQNEEDDFLTMSDSAKSILSKHILNSEPEIPTSDVQVEMPTELAQESQSEVTTQPQAINSTPIINQPTVEQTTPISQEVSQNESPVVNSMNNTPIETPTPKVTPVETQEEPISTPTQTRRGRKPNNKMQENLQNTSSLNDIFIPVMNQLAKDLIDILKKSDYKIARFNSEQMKILYDYMYTKF